jgi:hypothetical protein
MQKKGKHKGIIVGYRLIPETELEGEIKMARL